MQSITGAQCGDLLAIWLGKASGPENAKAVAKEAGFNDSPFFGADKKRIHLLGELVMVNTAIAIVAVNQVFDRLQAQSIIDPFLARAQKSVFSFLEQKDPDFKAKYEERMAEYFHVFSSGKPGLAVAAAFMNNLGLNALSNLNGQVLLTARFGDALKETINVLRRVTLRTDGPLVSFEREIQNWPVAQAKTALLLIKAVLCGDNAQIDKLYPELTVAQFRAVQAVIESMEKTTDV